MLFRSDALAHIDLLRIVVGTRIVSEKKIYMNTKISNNFKAKYTIWAQERKVTSLPKAKLPFKFPPQKFSSYKELNLWKRQLLVKIAENGGVKWIR